MADTREDNLLNELNQLIKVYKEDLEKYNKISALIVKIEIELRNKSREKQDEDSEEMKTLRSKHNMFTKELAATKGKLYPDLDLRSEIDKLKCEIVTADKKIFGEDAVSDKSPSFLLKRKKV